MKQTFFISLILSFPQHLFAQNTEHFIYGTIYTIDDKSYTGTIRWDDEEVFWSDFFNATKPANKYHEYLDESNMVKSIQKWFSWDSDEDEEHENHMAMHKQSDELVHIWVCQFGDIQTLQITGREKVDLTLKNGDLYHLSGGSNDLNTEINIMDTKLGELTLQWDRIKRVDFSKTPDNLSTTWGNPLFGTVYTTKGEFTGFIQWDHDERLTIDKLDGRTVDGEISIDFGNIQSITKTENGSLISLNSDREINLSGSNDVNEKNRGIVVTIDDLGRVDIPWSIFKKLEFTDAGRNALPSYLSFKKPAPLSGKVVRKDGTSVSGRLAYDLDEEMDFEMIQGKDEDLEYSVIMKNISKITPKNFSYSQIDLKNGKTLLIGGSHDVSEYNSGVLIFENEKQEPSHVKWNNVKEVVFN